MLDVAWSLAAFIVAIGVLVSFHEYGHFWVARRLGVKVLRFSIGFGRPLWRRVGADGVEYVVAAVPLGGYVKMLDEREDHVDPAEVHRAFNRQGVWTRIAIVCAGPLANFLLAAVAYWAVFVAGVPGLKPVIADPPPASRAAAVGLVAGEEIVAVDGASIPTWQVLRTELIDRALDARPLRLSVRGGDGNLRETTMPLDDVRVDPEFLFTDLGLSPFQPDFPPVLDRVLEGESAEAAGLRSGDRLLARGGVGIATWQDWVRWLRAHPGTAVELAYERDGERRSTTVILGSIAGGDGGAQGRFGASVAVPPGVWDNLATEHRLGIFAAVPAAVAQTARMSGLTLKLLYRMVIGDVSVKNVSGPIQIAQFAGYSASIGLVSFLSFIAIVSVSLGVLNLLPIPVLDGGHLLYYVVELFKGSPVSERTQAVGQQVGLTLLVMLMGLAFYNDILRLID